MLTQNAYGEKRQTNETEVKVLANRRWKHILREERAVCAVAREAGRVTGSRGSREEVERRKRRRSCFSF